MQKCCFWIRENFALTVGIALPLLMVVVFGVAAAIPAMFIAAPKYELVFSATKYDNESSDERRFKVVDERVKVEIRASGKSKPSRHLNALYRYDPKTDTLHEIEFDVPPAKSDADEWRSFSISSLKTTKIDSNKESPDGYVMQHRAAHGGMGLQFSDYGRGSSLELENSGRIVKVPTFTGTAGTESFKLQSMQNPVFIGWIIPEEGK